TNTQLFNHAAQGIGILAGDS
ncbi:hypothetical protein D030_0076B, partial [Vibrio parahaemolyticus AQ3810]